MRFNVVGANSETGDDVDVLLDATSREEIEKIAHEKHILVSVIKEIDEGTGIAIALTDDEPAELAASSAPAGAAPVLPVDAPHAPDQKGGLITVSANSPSDTAHSAEGHIPESHKVESAMEYHIMMNQALYLLETAVNKYLRDGWEPQGGLTVGMSNNAMQYFQALVRRKKS